MSRSVVSAVLVTLATMASTLSTGVALDVPKVRELVSRYNVSCVLVFGDSSVDPGNNNHLATTFKGNFPPYGKDFLDGRATGRFSNGRLPTDIIAETLGYTKIITAFLDPNLSRENLLHGVSFASAASGYDDLTANLTNVLPISKQLQYLLHYKIKLRRLVGEKKAEEIIRNSIFVLSLGTNDFIQNYFIEPLRSTQYTVEQYGNFLLASLMKDIKGMLRIGGRRLVVVGVPPIGCMPLVKTILNSASCGTIYNNAALSFNNKIKAKLSTLKTSLGVSSLYVDAYNIILKAVQNPKKYGFEVSTKGCCGTGTIEYGDTCRGMSTCEDASKYVFWDAVHPTEHMYKIIADEAVNSLATDVHFFG